MANVLGELFGDIASAIREKTGDAEKMKPADFPEKISSIETGTGTGTDVSGVTATAEDVLEGKTIVDASGNEVTGGMTDNGAFSTSLSVSGGKTGFNIPKGYHNGEGVIKVLSRTKTATPSKTKQVISDSDHQVQWYLESVTVNPIPDEYQNVSNVTATADDVRSGKVFVDAEGNEVEGALSGTIADVSEVTAEAEDVLEGKVIVTSTGSKVYGALAVDNLAPGEVIVYKKKKIGGFTLDSTFGAFSPGYVSPSEFTLEGGKSYRVIWDGVEWNCEAFAFEMSGMSIVAIGNASSLGLSGNGEPFLITYNVTANNTQFFSTEQKAEHTIGIYTEATSEILLQEKTVTENGVVEPDAGFDGLSKVIVDVLASGGGNAKIASGTFTGGTANLAVSHNLGAVPDMIILWCNASITTTAFGMVYFAVGMTEAMRALTTFDRCQFGCSYGFGSWGPFSLAKDITQTSGTFITKANATQFTVSNYYDTAKSLEYRWMAISGLT